MAPCIPKDPLNGARCVLLTPQSARVYCGGGFHRVVMACKNVPSHSSPSNTGSQSPAQVSAPDPLGAVSVGGSADQLCGSSLSAQCGGPGPVSAQGVVRALRSPDACVSCAKGSATEERCEEPPLFWSLPQDLSCWRLTAGLVGAEDLLPLGCVGGQRSSQASWWPDW